MSETGKPLVTIGIPTYNRADGYLREALESALSQGYENLEIVISDNCSTDHTEEVVKSYKDPRIQYFRHEKNIGANNNFNFCLEKARGEYFLLLHDDDLIDPDFIETCMEGINHKAGVGVIRTGVRVIDENGNELQVRYNSVKADTVKQFIEQWMDQRNVSLYLCSVLFHTRGLKKIGGFQSPMNLLQDNVAEIKLTAQMGRKDLYPVKASFRRHGGNRGDKDVIYEWASDSIFLLELIKGYVDDEELLKKTGDNLCQWNYYRAGRIASLTSRWQSYFINYKTFKYRYSPIYFLYLRSIKPRIEKYIGM